MKLNKKMEKFPIHSINHSNSLEVTVFFFVCLFVLFFYQNVGSSQNIQESLQPGLIASEPRTKQAMIHPEK